MNIHSLSRFAFSSLSENVFSSLTQGQKKILVIASLVFSGLSMTYLAYRYFFQTKQVNVEENLQPQVILSTTEKKLKTLTPFQVEAIAKKVVAIVMNRLKMDVVYKALAGETYPDTSGKRHQVYWDQYDPSSPLMTSLLPSIIQQIQDAVAHPTEFVASGLTFKFMDTRDHSGLIYQIPSPALLSKIASKVDAIIKNFDLNSAVFEITLRVDDSAGMASPLSFDMHSWLNGAQIGHTGGSLPSLEKSANQCAV